MEQRRSLAVFYCILFLVLIYIGRLQELIGFLNNLHIAKIVMIVALILYFISMDAYFEHNAVLSKIVEIKFIKILFVISVCSIPFSHWTGGSFDYVTSYYIKLLLFFFLLIWCICSEYELYLICWAFIFAIFLIDMISIVRPSEVTGRTFVSSSYDPNDMALLLVISIPIMFYMMEHSHSVKKIFLLIVIMLTLILIVKTGSRGGLLALVTVLFFIGCDKGIGYTLKRLPLFLVLVAIVLMFSPQEQMDRLHTIFQINEDYNATDRGGRIEIWKRAITTMITRPLLGCGINQFSDVNGMMSGGSWHTAHNSFFQLGAELGLIAFFVFIMLIRSLIVSLDEDNSCFERAWLIRAVKISLYGFCVGGFFLSWAFSYGLYFLFALAIIVKKINMNSQNSRNCAV